MPPRALAELRFALLASLLVACARDPAAAPAAAPSSGHPRGDHFHMRFERAEEWSRVFDDPARDAWQQPEKVIDALALAPDARVADIGAGTGYFAVRLARRVTKGVVHAADVEPDMIRFLRERAEREKLPNLVPVLSTPDGANLPEVDLAIVVDTYHHIPAREAYFGKLRAKRLAIIDFTRESEMGPPREHRIPPEQVERELGASGWRKVSAHAFLPNQYFLVFER